MRRPPGSPGRHSSIRNRPPSSSSCVQQASRRKTGLRASPARPAKELTQILRSAGEHLPRRWVLGEPKPADGPFSGGRITGESPPARLLHAGGRWTAPEVLLDGRTKSCGCLRADPSMRREAKIRLYDLCGRRFGLLAVPLDAVPEIREHHIYWPCVCDCGVETVVRGDFLRNGRITSCGCLRSEPALEAAV